MGSVSILSYNELVELVEQGVIDAPIENINGSSIDLTLGDVFYREEYIHPNNNYYGEPGYKNPHIELSKPSQWMKKVEMENIICLCLQPGEFVLAQAREKFNLPLDITASYMLKSSQGRSGLGHQLAGHIDPGWEGYLTLEFMNVTRYHIINLRPGEKCGQVVFHRHTPVPLDKSYKVKGQYMNDKGTSLSKGMR